MISDDAWKVVLLLGEGGPKRRHVPLVGGRLPRRIRLPIDEEWFEQFSIESWDDDEPVYRTQGYVMRADPEVGL